MRNVCIRYIANVIFLRRNLRLEIKLIWNRDVEKEIEDLKDYAKNFEAIIREFNEKVNEISEIERSS